MRDRPKHGSPLVGANDPRIQRLAQAHISLLLKAIDIKRESAQKSERAVNIYRLPDGSVPATPAALMDVEIRRPRDIDPNSPGGRLFRCRLMARISRTVIEDVCGLTRGHLTRIENGDRGLSNIYTLYKIVGLLAKYGVDVDIHWLALGIHEEPTYNQRFWIRFPDERPGGRQRPALPPAVDLADGLVEIDGKAAPDPALVRPRRARR